MIANPMLKAYRNILIVVKQSAYEQYQQLKAQGKAPLALRWERLKDRYTEHRRCVDDVIKIVGEVGIPFSIIGREELHRGSIEDKDLVISVGGDGTILNTSSFIDDTIPVLGINSDPTKPTEHSTDKKKDERRSQGALCGTTSITVKEDLPRILYGDISPGLRSRLQCLVRSTYTETRLPPCLNDVLLCHPSPAAVSRFRLTLCRGTVVPSYKNFQTEDEMFSFNAWSSGIWISTAAGSTAAMHAAGGHIMDIHSRNLQYMVREHLVENNNFHQKKAGHSIIRPDEFLKLRWNSQVGCVFVDGSHFRHDLDLGDEIRIDGHAPFLKIFDPIKH